MIYDDRGQDDRPVSLLLSVIFMNALTNSDFGSMMAVSVINKVICKVASRTDF